MGDCSSLVYRLCLPVAKIPCPACDGIIVGGRRVFQYHRISQALPVLFNGKSCCCPFEMNGHIVRSVEATEIRWNSNYPELPLFHLIGIKLTACWSYKISIVVKRRITVKVCPILILPFLKIITVVISLLVGWVFLKPRNFEWYHFISANAALL